MGLPRETSDLQSVEERFAVGIRGRVRPVKLI